MINKAILIGRVGKDHEFKSGNGGKTKTPVKKKIIFNCRMCDLAARDKFAGSYDLKCVACCARLVKAARPLSRAHQESMLEVIARTRGAPTRKAVLDFLESEK